jgi:thiamine biosynthesis protein ThiI
MVFKAFLIKYAEIGVKGGNRYIFENALVRQIRSALTHCTGNFHVRKEQGRIFVEVETENYDYDETVAWLQKVFGISGICPMIQVEDEGIDKLKEDAVNFMKEVYGDPKMTFKVHTRRARKNYPIDSMRVNEIIGEELLDEFPGLKVDVHKPDAMLNIEVREHIYIYSITIPGPGGMPIGTAGKAMLLLSGGIDSPVAGYMIAKRGVQIDAVYFHAPPYTSERAKQKVVDLAHEISVYTGQIRLHVINFTDVQLAIYEGSPHEELTIIMRRYMMRIAEQIALQEGAIGLITGESIGQVASQTMQSMLSTNEVCEMPVYRPLIGFDKQEIVAISEKIGTFETSIQPYEDCCTIFVAKHPVTKPKPEIIRKHEDRIKEKLDALMQIAIETDEVIVIRSDDGTNETEM